MKLTIITINRNNALGLERTILSVLSQTYKSFEYVIVDGASTDASVSIIEKLIDNSEKQISIKWISEQDKGIYNAMNKGIKMALGEFLLFLNSGDFLLDNNVLEKVFEEDIDADIICARCNVSDNGKVVWTSPYQKRISLKTLYVGGLPHQSTFIRRSMFDKYGLYREDFQYNSDIAFWYKAIVFGSATTKGIDVITTDYNLQGQSTTDCQTEAYKKEMQEILSEGFLPKVLPDYDEEKRENALLQKYIWIEKHPSLLKILTIYNKIIRHFRNQS